MQTWYEPVLGARSRDRYFWLAIRFSAMQVLERYALSDTAREDYLASYEGDRYLFTVLKAC